ncbi:uncharacterized protein LOC106667117 isoform X2 [Cimex lectularius]|uniref:F-box domain-containing protein n=1 Tax=Cimex lectularius TaxID=79782 RepID=A0A8I6SGY4_CIMLE|nr:uncharacterized protein LOC106667117 isoform X2 [Cimex lectularius]
MDSLPPELIQEVALYLPPRDIINCSLVCKHWSEALNIDKIWKRVTCQVFGVDCSKDWSRKHLPKSISAEFCKWRRLFLVNCQLCRNWRKWPMKDSIDRETGVLDLSFINLSFNDEDLIILYSKEKHLDYVMYIWNINGEQPVLYQKISGGLIDEVVVSFFQLNHHTLIILQEAIFHVFKKGSDSMYRLSTRFIINLNIQFDHISEWVSLIGFEDSELCGLFWTKAYIKRNGSNPLLICIDLSTLKTKFTLPYSKYKDIHCKHKYIIFIDPDIDVLELWDSFNGTFVKCLPYQGQIMNFTSSGEFFYTVCRNDLGEVRVYDENNNQVSCLRVSYGFISFSFLWSRFAVVRGVIQSTGYQPFYSYFELWDFGALVAKKMHTVRDTSLKLFINKSKTKAVVVKFKAGCDIECIEIVNFLSNFN